MGGDRSWNTLIGERVRLRELRILHAVVQAGSMAKAAQALSMTQPAISQAIGHLEAALNLPVLERSPAGVVPTAFGAMLLRRALEAADVLADGLREIEALADPDAGEIVVGASESYIAGGALTATIVALRQRYKRMRIDVVESNTAAMDFADLRERRVDVMLGRGTGSKPPEDVRARCAAGGGASGRRRRPQCLGARGRAALRRRGGQALGARAGRHGGLRTGGGGHRAEGVAMRVPAVTTYSMMLRLQLLARENTSRRFPRAWCGTARRGGTWWCCRCGWERRFRSPPTLCAAGLRAGRFKPLLRLPASSIGAMSNRFC